MTKTEIIKKIRALKVIKRFITYNVFYITPHEILSDMAQDMMDGKEVDISDTQRYKMCGNGVVVNCVDYIYSLISNLDDK